jgi:hypothetical protein
LFRGLSIADFGVGIAELKAGFKVQRSEVQGYRTNALGWRLEVGGDNKLGNFTTRLRHANSVTTPRQARGTESTETIFFPWAGESPGKTICRFRGNGVTKLGASQLFNLCSLLETYTILL